MRLVLSDEVRVAGPRGLSTNPQTHVIARKRSDRGDLIPVTDKTTEIAALARAARPSLAMTE